MSDSTVKRSVVSLLAALALLVVAGSVSHSSHADSRTGGPAYAIDWHTIDTGGGTSSGGSYTLTGTIGQHDAGGPMTGGELSLTGGFWGGASGEIVTCPGDLTADDVVGVADLLQLLSDWNTPGSDLDGDNNTGVSDLLIVLGAWGMCPP